MAAARQGSSLLRRLQRDADPTSAGRSYYRGEDLEAVVLDHLREMLGTRMGSALTVPDYGMMEVSDMLYEFPDAIGIIQATYGRKHWQHKAKGRRTGSIAALVSERRRLRCCCSAPGRRARKAP